MAVKILVEVKTNARLESIIKADLLKKLRVKGEKIDEGFDYIKTRQLVVWLRFEGRDTVWVITPKGIEYLDAHAKENAWNLDRRLVVLTIVVAIISAALGGLGVYLVMKP